MHLFYLQVLLTISMINISINENRNPYKIIYYLQESWTKGRLHCSHCNNRIGSFNFINVLRCDCNQFVTHPIRIINSKVDIVYDTK